MNESVYIPRFSPKHREYTIYSNVEKFSQLAYKLYRSEDHTGKKSPASKVLQELAQIKTIAVPELQELFDTIKEACFAYKTPKTKPIPRKAEPMFSNWHLKNFYKQKHALKAVIQMHLPIIAKIQKVEVVCWKSRAKVQKYLAMVQAAESAVQHYKDDRKEFEERTKAIKSLKNMFTAKQNTHIKNLQEYDYLIVKEIEIGKKMKEIAFSLRTEIVSCIKRKLESGFNDLMAASYPTECSITSDLTGISERLYELTCKKYEFEIPKADPTYASFHWNNFQSKIYKQVNHLTDIKQNFGCKQSMIVIENSSDSTKVERTTLPLKKGDKVKLQFISNNGLTGFRSVKHSSLSPKKWGFFNMCDMIPKHPRDCCS